MISRIYYYGLLGSLKKMPVGGGQTSARRVIEGLRTSGFEVITTDRHWNTKLTRIGHLLETGFLQSSMCLNCFLNYSLVGVKKVYISIFHIQMS